MTSPAFAPILKKAADGHVLSADEVGTAMGIMLSGDASPVQIATFLTALKVRGETPDEIAAAATAMREKADRFDGPAGAIDTCGTGGDGSNTYNISTAVAFVLAACGVPVAKHGNKAVSSASGSSDVLTALGVNIMAEMDVVKSALTDIGVTFLFAQRHHPAVRHVAPVRGEMGMRTLFNMLGPLTNPAGAEFQLLGVYDKALTEPVAKVLKSLGATSAWVVHGSDGLDELTTTGPSHVTALGRDGSISSFEVTPEEAGLETTDPAALVGGTPEENAAALRRLLEGETGAYRDIVLMNAAAGLVVAGKAVMLSDGVKHAAKAIDDGKALEKLTALVQRTNS